MRELVPRLEKMIWAGKLQIKSLLVLSVLMLLCLPTVNANESGVLTGKVLNQEGYPLVGAVVVIKDSPVGAVTDVNGEFSLKMQSSADVVVASYLGFESKEVAVGSLSNIDIVLGEDTNAIEEVVVVAYGTSNKATITGAITSVGTEELMKSPVVNVTQSLAGTMPGLSTVQDSGQPGRDASTIYIRGSGSLSNSSSSVLVLVDGVERSFSDLDANEIETITVLKDASATAVFGVRGANGVMLVTTRRGSIGKPQISFSTSFGLQEPITLAEQANSYDYARMWNIRAENDGTTSAMFTDYQLEAFRTNADPLIYPSIDWQDYMLNKYSIQSKNNITVSGGTEKVKYFVNVGYIFQDGVLKQQETLDYDNNYKYDKYSFRSNLDVTLTNTTTLKFNIGGKFDQIQEPIMIEDISYGWNTFGIWTLPFAGAGIVDGLRTLSPKSLYPLGETMRDGFFTFYGYGYDQEFNTKLNVDVDLTQDLSIITPGLTAGVKVAYNNTNVLTKRRLSSLYTGATEYQTAYYASTLSDPTMAETDPYFDKTVVFVPEGENQPLGYSEGKSFDRDWYMEARLNYSRTFNQDHNVGALLLYNQSRNYYPDTYSYLPQGYVGLVGRVTYAYQNKYLLDLNMGYNGSENFAPGKNRFGLFPSVSVGWVATEENFMKNQDVITFLKLRASWGRVGSDVGNSTRFMYMADIWNSANGDYNFGSNNPNSLLGATLSTSGNSDVTWETADKQNYGIDINFLDNRLRVNADYFFENRSNILITPNNVASLVATTLPNMNLGIVENQGYEVAVNWADQVGSDWRYNINANVAYAKNKIIFMDEVENEYSYMNQTGKSTNLNGNMYDFVRMYDYSDFDLASDGTYTLKKDMPQPYIGVQPGDAMYRDLNGDNIIDTNDQMIGGYSTRPEFSFGLGASVQYKGWSFSMQWAGAAHVDKMMESDYRTPFTNSGSRGLLQYFVEESWTPETSDSATMPRLSKNMVDWNCAASTLWLKDATYIRLKTLNLGYTFMKMPERLHSIGIKSLTVTLSGYNLLTLSGLKILDPETISNNTGNYPVNRVYNVGVNLNF